VWFSQQNFTIEATGVCIPIGNRDILLAALYKSPGHTWNAADITELLSLRHKCILAGDLNAKHQSWNSAVSNPLGQKLLQLFDTNYFEISGPQSPSILVHKNIRIWNVIVCDILVSDQLPIVFHIRDHVRTNKVPKPFEIVTVWQWSEILTSNLISSRITNIWSWEPEGARHQDTVITWLWLWLWPKSVWTSG
jgi:hypothetical protein